MSSNGKFVGNQEEPKLLKVRIYELPKLQHAVHFKIGECGSCFKQIRTTYESEAEGNNKELLHQKTVSTKQRNNFQDTSMAHVKEQISNKIPPPPPLPPQPQTWSQNSTIKFSKNPHKKIEKLKNDFLDELKERLRRLKFNDN